MTLLNQAKYIGNAVVCPTLRLMKPCVIISEQYCCSSSYVCLCTSVFVVVHQFPQVPLFWLSSACSQTNQCRVLSSFLRHLQRQIMILYVIVLRQYLTKNNKDMAYNNFGKGWQDVLLTESYFEMFDQKSNFYQISKRNK